MSVLGSHDIMRAMTDGHLTITGYNVAQLQPASYDVRLGDEFLVPNEGFTKIDPFLENTAIYSRRRSAKQFLLPSMGFVLAATEERFNIGPSMVGRIEGKSSLGRLGLIVHVTAGFIDPGFEGIITLELHNVSRSDIILTPGMLIAQVSFAWLATPLAHADLYKGKYQHDSGPQASRYHLNERPVKP